MKHVLVVHYSQSGQLTEIINNICEPLKASDKIKISEFRIEMEKPYPFPWAKNDFFGVFPETFNEVPEKVKPIPQKILDAKYDLIIFGYQIWYLTPSLPATSFFALPQVNELFNNTPVVTVIGGRNMWIMAQEKLKMKLHKFNANLVGNIVLIDRHINHISVITIVRWMFTGKKEKIFGIFPKPGVSQKDINESTKFGHVLKSHIQHSDYTTLQDSLLKKGAVTVKPFLVMVDKRANLIFSKWAKLISSKSKKNTLQRNKYSKLFNYYLLFAIWCIAPIVFVLFLLTYVFNLRKIKKDKTYYSSVAYHRE